MAAHYMDLYWWANPDSSSVLTCDVCEDQRCVHCQPGKRSEGQEETPDIMFSLTQGSRGHAHRESPDSDEQQTCVRHAHQLFQLSRGVFNSAYQAQKMAEGMFPKECSQSNFHSLTHTQTLTQGKPNEHITGN